MATTPTRPTGPRPRRSRVAIAFVALSGLGVTAVGCGGDDGAPERSYTLRLRAEDDQPEYMYIAEDPIDIRVGDEVTFELENVGTLPHDLRIVDPDGVAIASAPPVAPGDTATLTVEFEQAGIHQLNCLVGNHLTEHGMQALVEVTEPDT